MRDQLEQRTPVVLVQRELPAVLLIGAPDGSVLDSIFSTLTLLAVRVGAMSVIIDASGLTEPTSTGVLEALERLLSHRKIRGKIEVLVVGLDPQPELAWLAVAAEVKTNMAAVRDFERAVEAGLARSGYRVVRTSSS
jgi:hypothetical protein